MRLRSRRWFSVRSMLPISFANPSALCAPSPDFPQNCLTRSQPIEAFDEMVETWYAIGGEQLTEEANELYNPNNA